MDEYIERELALKTIRDNFSIYFPNVLDAVRRIPTADVQPVKHGKWKTPVSVGNGIKFCSVCRNEAYWDTDYGQQLFNYCPYCGARMDGDDDETL